jgi:parallel beta-helix repeat protein
VLNNKILYCETGISNGANNLLTGNTISKCLMEGIVVGGDGPSTIENNSISNIREMAILNYTHKSNFISNTISYSHRGIDTYGSDNKVYGNTFISNRIQAYEHGGSLWDYEGQGNYWNDYSGVDTNGDGIGDTPYSIFPIGMDSYPLMESTVDIPPISVSVIPVSLSFSDIAAGDTNIALVKINLKVTPADSAQIASWAGIRVDRSGTIEDDEILSVEIWNDVDGNERFDAGSDGEIAEGHFSNGTVTITFSSFEEIIPYSQTYFIVFDISDTLSDSNSTIGVKFADSSYFKFLYPAEVLATNFPFESELFPVAELEHTEDIPETFELSQNYPNPFNSETIIKYQLPKSTEVELKIYNILGQQVAVLVDEKQNAGYYRVKWSGTNDRGSKVVSGIYICRLQSKEFVKSFKLIVLR